MQEKVSKLVKKFKKVIDNETFICYYKKKVKINATFKQNCVSKRIIFLKGSIIMKRIKVNKKRFFKFLFVVSLLAVGAIAENGNITGAIVLAMLI